MTENKKLRILVIDDEVTQRMLVKDYLEEAGHMVRQADDGRRGLKMATSTGPDLVLLDVMLPSIDGFELCRSLKEHPVTAQTPVILITASREGDVIAKGLAAGADDFITKPVDWEFLADRVAHVARKASERAQLLSMIETAPAPAAAPVMPVLDSHHMVGVEEMMRASELQSHYATAQLDAEIAAVKAQFEDELARVRAENDRLVVIAREEQRSRAAASLAAEQAHADELARLRAQVEAEHGRLVAEQQVRRAEAQAREAELKALRETLRAEREEAEAKIDQLTNAISAAPSPSSIAAPWSVALRNLGWQASLAAAVLARLKAAMASPARLDGAKLAEIERNVQALSTSIQNLSRFAHTLASASECKQAPVDLSVLVAQIAAQAKGIAANANVGLETRVTGTDRVMVADEARLRCAWVCLVVNAIRFTPAGGTVSLEVHSLPDGSLRLEVADTGAGIAPDKLAELNAVLDSGVSATPGRPGDVAGLGIPTAAALARQMGGTFELESQPGHGTRALMVFPKSRQAQSAARQALAG